MVTVWPISRRMDFLSHLYEHQPEDGFIFLGFKDGQGFRQQPIQKNEFQRLAPSVLRKHCAKRWDQYFCPNIFADSHRLRASALPSSIVHVDVDDSDPALYDPSPSILVESSPDRFHAYWFLDGAYDVHIVEGISKALAYAYGGDKNGWTITKFLRIPGTINHKPERNSAPVRLGFNTGKIHDGSDLWAWATPTLRDLSVSRLRDKSGPAAKAVRRGLRMNIKALRQRVLREVRHEKARSIVLKNDHVSPDRSRNIWIAMVGLREP